MNTIKMNTYGRTLTDREFGKSVAAAILAEASFPVILDFKGVITLGSSCGDEILNAIAPRQGNRVEVMNLNQPVRSCLEKVALDSRIEIIILDPST